jgi:hypothetical protein
VHRIERAQNGIGRRRRKIASTALTTTQVFGERRGLAPP